MLKTISFQKIVKNKKEIFLNNKNGINKLINIINKKKLLSYCYFFQKAKRKKNISLKLPFEKIIFRNLFTSFFNIKSFV